MRFIRSLAERGNGVLNRLSRFLNIDVQYFVRSGFWTYLGYGGALLCRLVLLIVMARVADKGFYGEYQFISTILFTFMVFSMPGMDTAIVQSVARGYESSFFSGTRSKLRWSLMGSVALVGVSLFFKFVRPQPFWHVFLAMAVLFPLFAAISSIMAYYRGKEQFDKAALYEVLLGVLGMIAGILALLLTKSLFAIMISSMIVAILVFVFAYLKLARNVKRSPVDKNIVSYGRHVTFMSAINFLTPFADRFVIAFIAGFEVLAVYTIATSIPLTLSFCGKLFSSLLLPKLSRAHSGHAYRIKTLFWEFALVSAVMVVVVILVMPWLIPFVFSEKYVESVRYAQVALIYLMFFVPTSVLYAFFQGRKLVKLLYAYNLGTGVLELVLLALMTSFYGVWGVILSKVIVGLLGFVFLTMVFYRKH